MAPARVSLADRFRLRVSALLMRSLLHYIPKNPAILAQLGLIESVLGRLREADRLLDASLGLDSNQPDTWFKRAQVLETLGRRDDALRCYDQAIALRPDFAAAVEAHHRLFLVELEDAQSCVNRGNQLLESGKAAEATQYFDRALELEPKHARAHNGRGVALQSQRRLEEALASYDRAIALDDRLAEAHRNRGAVLSSLERFEESIASSRRALELEPRDAGAWYNRAQVLLDTNRPAEAVADLDRAIALNPDFVLAHWNKSLCKLLAGDLEEGFRLYEWRWRMRGEDPKFGGTLPLWLGDAPIKGKTLLLMPEQGFGDLIHFCRYVPWLERLGAKVVMMLPAAARPLLETLSAKLTVVEIGQPLPVCDYICSILSLPLAFKTTLDSIPDETPYLAVDSGRQETWKERLGPSVRPRVGLAWSGNRDQQNDHNRSIPLKLLGRVLDLPLEFHAVQKDLRPEDAEAAARHTNLHLHESDLEDFADAAALIGEMNLVISVDSAPLHVAGALGKPVWILLPWAGGWRWLLDRNDSPWYPTARLFRQPTFRDWPAVIDEVEAQLRFHHVPS